MTREVTFVSATPAVTQTTEYEYYTDTSDAARRAQVKSMLRYDGSWERYDYDTYGRKSSEISTYLDAAPDAAADSARESMTQKTWRNVRAELLTLATGQIASTR